MCNAALCYPSHTHTDIPLSKVLYTAHPDTNALSAVFVHNLACCGLEVIEIGGVMAKSSCTKLVDSLV
jgi:hypothetical protein